MKNVRADRMPTLEANSYRQGWDIRFHEPRFDEAATEWPTQWSNLFESHWSNSGLPLR